VFDPKDLSNETTLKTIKDDGVLPTVETPRSGMDPAGRVTINEGTKIKAEALKSWIKGEWLNGSYEAESRMKPFSHEFSSNPGTARTSLLSSPTTIEEEDEDEIDDR